MAVSATYLVCALCVATGQVSDWRLSTWVVVVVSLILAAGIGLGSIAVLHYRVTDDRVALLTGFGAIALTAGLVLPGLSLLVANGSAENALIFVGGLSLVSGALVAFGFAAVATSSQLEGATWRVGAAACAIAAIAPSAASGFARLTDTGDPLAAQTEIVAAVSITVTSAIAVLHFRRWKQTDRATHAWAFVILLGVALGETLTATEPAAAGSRIAAGIVVLTALVAGQVGLTSDLVAVFSSELRSVDRMARAQARSAAQWRQRERTIAQLAHDQRSAALALESVVEVLDARRATEGTRPLTELLGSEIHRMRRRVESIDSPGSRPTRVAVWDVIEPIVGCYQTRIDDLRVHVADGVQAFTDPDELSEAVSAILSNAITHGGGGLVVVDVRCDGIGAIVSIEDDGPGIPEPFREVIFDRGVTTEVGDHLGLGLFGARRSMAACGGSITVSDRSAGGARFDIHLSGSASGTERDDSDEEPLAVNAR